MKGHERHARSGIPLWVAERAVYKFPSIDAPFLRVLFRPIPDFSFFSKPIDLAFDTFVWFRNGDTGRAEGSQCGCDESGGYAGEHWDTR
jgi:hypothetical protein